MYPGKYFETSSFHYERYDNNSTFCGCCKQLIETGYIYHLVPYSAAKPGFNFIYCEHCTKHPGFNICPSHPKLTSNLSKQPNQ
jgi:hypothetical protein